MVRLLLTFLFLIWSVIPGITAEQWIVGRPLSSDSPVSYPAASLANNDSLDRLFATFQQGMKIVYASATTLSVTAGSGVCVDASNVHYFRQNTSSTTLNTSNLDTGSSFSNGTTYYIYENCSADATTATFTISLNSSAPSGVTAYRLMGNFTTDSSGNIAQITDNYYVGLGTKSTSYSNNTIYQANTDGFVVAQGRAATNDAATFYIVSDASSTPSSVIAKLYTTSSTTDLNGTLTVPVKKGNYWEVIASGSQYITGINWIPIGQ